MAENINETPFLSAARNILDKSGYDPAKIVKIVEETYDAVVETLDEARMGLISRHEFKEVRKEFNKLVEEYAPVFFQGLDEKVEMARGYFSSDSLTAKGREIQNQISGYLTLARSAAVPQSITDGIESRVNELTTAYARIQPQG